MNHQIKKPCIAVNILTQIWLIVIEYPIEPGQCVLIFAGTKINRCNTKHKQKLLFLVYLAVARFNSSLNIVYDFNRPVKIAFFLVYAQLREVGAFEYHNLNILRPKICLFGVAPHGFNHLKSFVYFTRINQKSE